MKGPRLLGLMAGVLGLAACILLRPDGAEAAKRLRVVATNSAFGHITRAIGGNTVSVYVVTSPRRNVHSYNATPRDVVKLSKADLFIHGGLDLELWRGPLVEASRNTDIFPGGRGDVNAAQGIPLLDVPNRPVSRAEGDIHVFGNPHYWLSPDNGERIAGTVLAGLVRVAPEKEGFFRQQYEAFVSAMRERRDEWERLLAPYRGKRIVAYHDSWPYFAQFSHLAIDIFLEPKRGIPPSGAHVARVKASMQQEGLKVIIVEPHHPKGLARRLARETGARVVELPTLPGGVKGTNGYLEMLDYQVRTLAETLGS